jgi:hypothetical protein
MSLKGILDAIVNKFHIIIGTVCQGVILGYHFKTGHDIGPGVVNTVYAFYALLVGHAFTYQKYPDGPQQ